MKKAMNNARNGRKTTIIGSILIAIAIITYFLPVVMKITHPEIEYEINNTYLVFCGLGGIVLIIMPDTFRSAVKKVIDKKTE